MKRIGIGIVGAILLLATGAAAQAAEPEGWQVDIAPLVWYAGLSGDVTVNGQKADFEKSASDLFDMVEAGGSVLADVQYKRVMITGLVDYFSLSTDELDVEDRPLGGKLDSKITLSEVGIGYQFDGLKEGQIFKLLIGVRTLAMKNDLEVYGDGTYSKDSEVTDPFIGVRPVLPLFPKKIKGLYFAGMFAIGAGGDADMIYEITPQLLYMLGDNFNLRFGYRTVVWEFEDGNDNELDLTLAGLTFGIGIKF